MKVGLIFSDNRLKELLMPALEAGFKVHGDTSTQIPFLEYRARGGPGDYDIAVFVGVRRRKLFDEHRDKKIHTLLIDKGYFDRKRYFRFSLDGFQPSYLDQMRMSEQRFRTLNKPVWPKKQEPLDPCVVYAGSSDKYGMWHGLGDVSEYAAKVCAELRRVLNDQVKVVYRPKPSWWVKDRCDKRVPEGTRLSDGRHETLVHILPNCVCLVTHGSNAAVEALLYGVPVCVLSKHGDTPIYQLAEKNITRVLKPYWPTDAERMQVFANMAWCQFTVQEMAQGIAWGAVRHWIK